MKPINAYVYEVRTLQELLQKNTAALYNGDLAFVEMLSSLAGGYKWTGVMTFHRTVPSNVHECPRWTLPASSGGCWVAEEHPYKPKSEPEAPPAGPRGATVPRMSAFDRIWGKFDRFYKDVSRDMDDAVKEVEVDMKQNPLPPGVTRTEETTVEEHKHNGLTIRVTKTVKRWSVTSVTKGAGGA